MDFNLTPEEESFRQEVRDFLAAELPPPEERGAGVIVEVATIRSRTPGANRSIWATLRSVWSWSEPWGTWQ